MSGLSCVICPTNKVQSLTFITECECAKGYVGSALKSG